MVECLARTSKILKVGHLLLLLVLELSFPGSLNLLSVLNRTTLVSQRISGEKCIFLIVAQFVLQRLRMCSKTFDDVNKLACTPAFYVYQMFHCSTL